MRLLVRPVAEKKAASEAEKRSAAATRLAVDRLQEQLKENDFRHVDDGLKALDGRLDRMDKRIGTVRKEVGERFDQARQDRKDMEGG